MKRLLVLVMATVMATFAVQAQAATWAGFKGGVNLGSVSGFDGTDTRTGLSGGAFIGTAINETFGFQLEGLYVMKGFTVDDATAKLDYIEFPILFVANFPTGDKLGFNIFGGPTLGFNIKAEIEEGGETDDMKDSTESFEFGAAIGGGFGYKLSSFSIVGDVRYTLGATTFSKDDTDDPKNHGIGIMAGVSFPLGSQE